MNTGLEDSMMKRRTILSMAVAAAATAKAPLAWAIDAANDRWIYDVSDVNDSIGEMEVYVARHEDTLLEIARKFGLGYVELRSANPGVDTWLPGEGTEVLLPNARILPDAPRRGVVINISEMRLYWYHPNGGQVDTYPIGIGREGRSTPLGQTTITRKATDPTWYPPESIRAERPELPSVVPPGPENPLGRHALYLGWPSYLIHGTNQPYGIGRRVSAGCIRMYPENVEQLHSLADIGTNVTVIDDPIKVGWIDGDLYVEACPSKYQADEIEMEGRMSVEIPGGLVGKVLAKASDHEDRVDWETVRKAALERRGYPVRVTL